MTFLPHFTAGAITLGYAVVAAFFLRFWRRTGDPLFGAFAGAFALMALNSILVQTLSVPDESRSLIYLVRLAAFALIIAAIVAKNRREKGPNDR